MIRTHIIVIFLVCFPAFGQARTPMDTNICAISAHPSRFHNKNVRIRATALGGMEASILIDTKDGQWNKECGRISLDFHSAGSDDSTSRFLRLFREQISSQECSTDEELKQGTAHILDPNVPAPKPCFSIICVHCPRYRIVATFIGRLRYSAREPGQERFGHMGMFDLQLDVATVSNLEVTDSLASLKQ